MRILMVASEVPPVRSGVARAVDHIAAGARDAGHEVVVRSYEDGRLFSRDQVRLSTVGFGLKRAWLGQFDLVHLHGPAPTMSDVLLLRRMLRSVPTPVVYTHHFTVWGDAPGLACAYRAYDVLARTLARAATRIVTTTPGYQAHVERFTGTGSVTVIPWGVDSADDGSPREPRSTNDLQVLLVGQMRRYKGHQVAIEACAGIPGLSLTIAGDGDLREELRSQAANSRNITIRLGPSDRELEEAYRTHDVILLPSTNVSEAFGIVLVEGMARGCLPVASDLRGVADVAGATGRLFTPCSARELRDVLVELRDDPATVAELGRRSMERAGGFTWSKTVAAYLRVYESVGMA